MLLLLSAILIFDPLRSIWQVLLNILVLVKLFKSENFYLVYSKSFQIQHFFCAIVTFLRYWTPFYTRILLDLVLDTVGFFIMFDMFPTFFFNLGILLCYITK